MSARSFQRDPGPQGLSQRSLGAEEPGEDPYAEPADDVLELEHVIGYTGHFLGTVLAHPTEPDVFLKSMASVVTIGDLNDPHQQEFLRGHDEEVTALAVSPGGSFVASGQLGSTHHKGWEAAVVVWDLASRQPVHRLPGLTQRVLTLAFSSDERFLCATGEDCLLYVWDVSTGEVIVGKKHLSPVTVAAWSPIVTGGRHPAYLLSTANSSSVVVNVLEYDIHRMKYMLRSEPCQMPTCGLVREYAAAVASPDGRLVYCGSTVGDMVIFNVESRLYRATVPVAGNGLLAMCVSPHSGHLFAAGGDGRVSKLLGQGENWEVFAETQLDGRVVSLSLAADGSEVLAGTATGRTYRLLAEDLSWTELETSHVAPVTALAFGERPDVFATASDDGSLRVWDLSDYNVIAQARLPVGGTALAFLPERNQIASGWADCFIRCHDAADGRQLWDIANTHRLPVTSLAATNTYLVSGSGDGCVRVWSLRSRELLVQFVEHKAGVSGVLADLAQPHLIHSAGLDHACFTYDLRRERRVVGHQGAEGQFTALSQRADSEHELVTACTNGTILFWDCDVREPVLVLADPNRANRMTAIRVSPSGRFVALCGDDHLVKVFDLERRELVSLGHGHSATVADLQWSPDERQIVTVGADCCVCVWNFFGGGVPGGAEGGS